MRKSDLQSGMIVEIRDKAKRFIVAGNKMYSNAGWDKLSNFNNELKSEVEGFAVEACDIMKVYKPKSGLNLSNLTNDAYLALIWERKERKQVDFMTAIKALHTGRKITCEIDGAEYDYIPSDKTICSFGYVLRANNGGIPVATREILEGKWYIED